MELLTAAGAGLWIKAAPLELCVNDLAIVTTATIRADSIRAGSLDLCIYDLAVVATSAGGADLACWNVSNGFYKEHYKSYRAR